MTRASRDRSRRMRCDIPPCRVPPACAGRDGPASLLPAWSTSARSKGTAMPRLAAHLLLAVGGLAAGAAFANEKGSTVPLGTAITYQGELRTSGLPATGLQDFEACLFPLPDPDATPALACVTADDQPLDQAGRFTVTLDFDAAFDGSARYLEMRVRPGASGGAYTTLLPRQAIRPAPEALHAARAPWSGIADAPTGFADGVDNAGVTSLAAGAGLTTNPAAPGAGAPIATIGTLSVRPAGIDAGMLAPGAVGLAQIDPTQVQARLVASCAPGDHLTGIDSDGTPQCATIPARIDRVIDHTGDTGSEIALVLRADDRPLMAYYHATAANLRLHACADRSCSTGTTRALDSAGDVGRGPAMAIDAAGRALIAYQDVTNLALKLYVCADADCSAGSARTLDDARNVMANIALVIREDGRPLIAYGNSTDSNARVFDCIDAVCSEGTSRTVAGSMHASATLSITLAPDGLPVIAKGGFGGAGTPIFLIRCADPGCITVSVTTLANQYADSVAVIVRTNDRPLIAVSTQGSGNPVSVYDCTSTTCSTWTARPIEAASSDGVDMTFDGSAPVLAFHRFVGAGEARLRLHRCWSSTCSDGVTRTLAGAPGESVGNQARIAIRSDGRPVVAHYDATNDDLLLHICANSDCL